MGKWRCSIRLSLHVSLLRQAGSCSDKRRLCKLLFKILVQLAETVYTASYFEGKSASEFYGTKISTLMVAAYDAQPPQPGTMHTVIASGQRAEIISEYIIQIVKEATDHSQFAESTSQWLNATKGDGDQASWAW
jgi:hypothetical protein